MRLNREGKMGVAAAALAGMSGLALAGGNLTDGRVAQMGPDVFGGYPTTHVLVRFAKGQVPVGDGPFLGKAAIDAVMAKYAVTGVGPVIGFPLQDPELASELGLDRWYKVNTPLGTDVRALANELGAFPATFELVELDGIGGTAITIPNDPEFAKCWGQHNTGQNTSCGGTGTANADVNAPEAWDLWTGDDDITLAVIDSGVTAHVDFAGKMVAGWDTVNNQGTNLDDASCPHGTHCTGTAAANGDNNLGVAGMSWGAKIMPVRVLTGCSGNETDCGEGIMWAADHGAHVGTMSLQYYTGITFFKDAVEYGWNKGMVLIAATGNNQGPGTVAFPAKFPLCMGIGATTITDAKAGFSNSGPEIDICAPGQDVWSSLNANGYACFSGTSMATPHTAGLACLLWSYNPGMSNQEVVDALIANVKDLGPAGFDVNFGWGRIDAFKTLNENPPGLNVKILDELPTLVAPGAQVTLGVEIAVGPDTLVPGSEKLFYSTNGGGSFTSIPLVHVSGSEYEAQLPGFECGDEPAFYVQAEGVSSGIKTRPTGAPTEFYSYEVGTIQNTTVFDQGFNAGMPGGWTATGLWHVTGACANGASCDGGTYAYYGQDAVCNFNVGDSSGSLTSPEFNLTQGGTLEFCYRYGGEATNYDKAEARIDGETVWKATADQLNWKKETIVLAAGPANAKVEFFFDSVDGVQNSELGFQIDGVKVVASKVICEDGCYADCDASGGLTIDDFICFQTLFALSDPAADCDASGGLTIDDFICFQTFFAIGCG